MRLIFLCFVGLAAFGQGFVQPPSRPTPPKQHRLGELFFTAPVNGDNNTPHGIEDHEETAEETAASLLINATATGAPLKIRGPLTADPADGIRRPSAEKGFRYSKDEWWYSLLSLPRSYILFRIRKHLLINTLLAAIVSFCYSRWKILSIPMLGHTIAGGFLSLLLVFRHNTAYDRFYEARTLWSDAMTSCRMLALDIVTNLRPKAPESSTKLLALVSAFPDALTYCCLSGLYPLGHNVKKLVIPRYPQNNDKVLQPATLLLLMMQETLQEATKEFKDREPLDNLFLFEILDKVHRLTGILSGCEKIVKTPVPWSYSRHTCRFVTIWSATLAPALVSSLNWLTVPTVALVCWALLSIEMIGHLLENPYVGYSRSRRARMTQPYDIGIPVFVLSNQVRLEVEAIASVPAR